MRSDERFGGKKIVDLDFVFLVAVAMEGDSGVGGHILEPECSSFFTEQWFQFGVGWGGVKIAHQQDRQRMFFIVLADDLQQLPQAGFPCLSAKMVEVGVIDAGGQLLGWEVNFRDRTGPGALTLDGKPGAGDIGRSPP